MERSLPRNGVRRALVLCALLALAIGCGSGSQPTAPSPTGPPPVVTPPGPPPGPPPPTNVRVTAIDHADRSAVIQWNASEGAERYAVDYSPFLGGISGTRTVLTEGPETTVTLRDLPGDWLKVRVRAGNSRGFGFASEPSIDLQIPVLKDVIEALFFGTGPYGTGLFLAPGERDYFAVKHAHTQPGTMLGWRTGTVQVRVEGAATQAQFEKLVLVLAQVSDLTGGDVRPEIVARGGTLPESFASGELRVIIRDDLSVPCRTQGNVLGCAPQDVAARGELVAALIYLRPDGSPNVVTHEAGHALLGLHHVQGVEFPERPVMGIGFSEAGFSSLEVEAVRAVYAAGLRFGATRADFQARGLIN